MKDKVDPVVDEAIERLDMKDGPARRKLLKGAGLFSATAAASALISACTSSSNSSAGAAKKVAGNFPSTPKWQFWFVNHVTTNPFFTPTQYGMADAAALLGLPTPKWGGSETSTVSQMTTYISTAVSAKADGIAVAVIDPNAFKSPIMNAMNAGIPVLSYNADGSFVNGKAVIGSNRLAYVGQALFISGQQLGTKILSLIPGGGDIAIFIATPGSGNIQPRYDGAASVLSGKGFTIHEVATGATTGVEQPAIKSYLLGHKNIKGAFAVDGGSTEFLGTQLKAAGISVPSGGFDTQGTSLPNIKSGLMDFTIYQDPYLQGFLPVVYMYLFNLSGGTIVPPDTDTGLSFIEKATLGNYQVSSRFQGQTTAQKYIKRPAGAISNPQATTST
ncbi:MAG TPA: substrate-binding domain-containing protein [Trebonia sp.]|jgi:simple sugar transport system substrate-binding protein|nr:substrate-binding domain-containing protein [Trebonia sp.]